MLILTLIITLGLVQTTGVQPEAANLAARVGRLFAHETDFVAGGQHPPTGLTTGARTISRLKASAYIAARCKVSMRLFVAFMQRKIFLNKLHYFYRIMLRFLS